MAQHLSVPPPPCATQRYSHSSAFISGHESRSQSWMSSVMSGVASMGMRLAMGQQAIRGRHATELERTGGAHRSTEGRLMSASRRLPGGEIIRLPTTLQSAALAFSVGTSTRPLMSWGSCRTLSARYSASWNGPSRADSTGDSGGTGGKSCEGEGQ